MKSEWRMGSAANLLGGLWQNSGMIVIFLAIFAVSWLFVDNFGTWANMTGLLLSVATVGMIACTMMFCLASGDFDLSVGSVVAFSGVLAAVIVNCTGHVYLFDWAPAVFGRQLFHMAFLVPFPSNPTSGVFLGVFGGVAAGALVGLLNGFVIARIGINALITTLATMQIVRGAAFLASDGKAVGVSLTEFFPLGTGTLSSYPWLHPIGAIPVVGDKLMSLQMPIWIMIVCFVAFGVLLNKTTFGRNTLAIGGNQEAARLAGIAVTRTKIIIFGLQGMIAGLAGVILSSRMTSGQPNTSQGLELQVISACVLGGVSLTGGIASISGVVVGVLIMGTVQNVMNLKNVPTFWQLVASGAILLAAVTFDKLKQRRA